MKARGGGRERGSAGRAGVGEAEGGKKNLAPARCWQSVVRLYQVMRGGTRGRVLRCSFFIS